MENGILKRDEYKEYFENFNFSLTFGGAREEF